MSIVYTGVSKYDKSRKKYLQGEYKIAVLLNQLALVEDSFLTEYVGDLAPGFIFFVVLFINFWTKINE